MSDLLSAARHELRRAKSQADRALSALTGRGEIPTFDEFMMWAASQERLKTVMLDVKLSEHQAWLVEAFLDNLLAATSHVDESSLTITITSPYPAIVEAFREHLKGRDPRLSIRVALDSKEAGALNGTFDLGLRDVVMGKIPLRPWSSFEDEITHTSKLPHDGALLQRILWRVTSSSTSSRWAGMGSPERSASSLAISHSLCAASCASITVLYFFSIISTSEDGVYLSQESYHLIPVQRTVYPRHPSHALQLPLTIERL